ncbi:MAG: hypothetical protein IPL50_11415 [Chitinophagaceae bacterium]|nr:hypothetical protein [Chitinophagaceae bacterium]
MNNKIKLLGIALLVTVSITFAQSAQPTWAEMKTFHSLMSVTFHSAEDGNFVPLKAKADSLLIVAKLWQASPVPADFRPAETEAALEKLVYKCMAIKKAVRTGITDEKLLSMITQAHDIFHTVAGECRKTEG